LITIEVPTAREGHRKYAPVTPAEATALVTAIEEGEIEGVEGGPYFVMNKSTKRIVGKLDIKDSQELVMMPIAMGG